MLLSTIELLFCGISSQVYIFTVILLDCPDVTVRLPSNSLLEASSDHSGKFEVPNRDRFIACSLRVLFEKTHLPLRYDQERLSLVIEN